MRRFSISGMMALILILAVGLAALRNANSIWAKMRPLAALGMVLGAVILRGGERAWSGGFACFAGVYLAFAVGPLLSARFQSRMGTTEVLRQLYERMHVDEPGRASTQKSLRRLAILMAVRSAQARSVAQETGDPSILVASRQFGYLDRQVAKFQIAAPLYEEFQRVGHSLFAVLAGLAGGMVAGSLYARRARRNASRGHDPTPDAIP
jgi:hypothetical protein